MNKILSIFAILFITGCTCRQNIEDDAKIVIIVEKQGPVKKYTIGSDKNINIFIKDDQVTVEK